MAGDRSPAPRGCSLQFLKEASVTATLYSKLVLIGGRVTTPDLLKDIMKGVYDQFPLEKCK